MGEAWHNNHHAFPSSAVLGLDRGQLDIGAVVIRALERLGLVWNVHRPNEAQRARRRLT
jgi:stearoyl-CoA desaturase (delta-9 desaturase)